MSGVFARFAEGASQVAGHPLSFALAAFLIIIWLASGPIFGFSDEWQVWFNDLASIVMFLMAFVIQSTQNRDTKAMQVKLDELIRARHAARKVMAAEDADPERLNELQGQYQQLGRRAGHRRDTGTPPAPSADRLAEAGAKQDGQG